MATETLTTTTTAVTKVGERVLFPYASGQPAGNYSSAGAVLKVAGVTLPIGFGVSFDAVGAVLTPAAGCEIPAGVLTLAVQRNAGSGSAEFVVGDQIAAARSGAKFRLPGGAKVAWFGSSTVQGNHSVTLGPPAVLSSGPGIIGSVRQRDPRFNSPTWYDLTDTAGRNFHGANWGFSGTSMDTQVNYVNEIIAGGYDAVVLLNMGQNDLVSTTAISVLIGRLRSIAVTFRDAGLGVYLNPVNPRSVTGNSLSGGAELSATDPYWRRRIEYNNGVVALAQELGVELIDTRSALENAASPIKQAKTGVSKDGLHMTDYGHQLWADVAAPVFDRTIPPEYPHINLLAGSAGNLFTNGLLTGTAGQHSFNSTGSVPDKMRIGRVTTGTTTLNAVSSIVADPEEGNAIRTVMTLASAVSGSDEFRWLFSDSPGAGDTAFAVSNMAGKWAQGNVRIFIEEGAQYIQELRVLMEARSTLNNSGILFTTIESVVQRATNEPAGVSEPLDGSVLWLPTEPILCPVGTTHIAFKVQARFAGTGTTTLQVSRPAIREVADPRV